MGNYLNVEDNIFLPFYLTKELKITKEIKERKEFLLTKLGIQNKKNCNISKLSQGEKQRVAIARSIITKPKKKGMKARKPKGLKKLSRDILT